jgi:hypothetical protein
MEGACTARVVPPNSFAAEPTEIAREDGQVCVLKRARKESASPPHPHVAVWPRNHRGLAQLLPHQWGDHHRGYEDANRLTCRSKAGGGKAYTASLCLSPHTGHDDSRQDGTWKASKGWGEGYARGQPPRMLPPLRRESVAVSSPSEYPGGGNRHPGPRIASRGEEYRRGLLLSQPHPSPDSTPAPGRVLSLQIWRRGVRCRLLPSKPRGHAASTQFLGTKPISAFPPTGAMPPAGTAGME